MEYFNRDQAFPARGVFSGLPVQAIPTKRKPRIGLKPLWILLN